MLREKTIWLTGATGGLGPGIASRLAKTGAKLALHTHKRLDRALELQDLLLESGHYAYVTQGDLADPGVAISSVASIKRVLGPPYALVHLAGPLIRKPTLEHTLLEWESTLRGNVTSFFMAARALAGAIEEGQEGRLIATGMLGAQQTQPMAEMGPHLAAKSALVALVRTLAVELAPRRITVNAISPGHIPKKTLPREDARSQEAPEQHPMGVHGSYEDLARAIEFLLDPAADYMTGAVLDVTGGWRSL